MVSLLDIPLNTTIVWSVLSAPWYAPDTVSVSGQWASLRDMPLILPVSGQWVISPGYAPEYYQVLVIWINPMTMPLINTDWSLGSVPFTIPLITTDWSLGSVPHDYAPDYYIFCSVGGQYSKYTFEYSHFYAPDYYRDWPVRWHEASPPGYTSYYYGVQWIIPLVMPLIISLFIRVSPGYAPAY